MKLVFIYGPPAVGKLTVAKELSKLTGFKLFHNHVAIDFAKSVFDFGEPGFWNVVDASRKEMLGEAARSRVDTIFTFVYGGETDDGFVREVTRRVEEHKGRVCFVRLRCDRAEVLRRVGAASRKKMGKLATRSGLEELYERHDLEGEIPFAKSFEVDTGKLAPALAARAIALRYRLPIAR